MPKFWAQLSAQPPKKRQWQWKHFTAAPKNYVKNEYHKYSHEVNQMLKARACTWAQFPQHEKSLKGGDGFNHQGVIYAAVYTGKKLSG